jgi:hypothetical protein
MKKEVELKQQHVKGKTGIKHFRFKSGCDVECN